MVDIQQVPIPSTSLSMARRSMSADDFKAYEAVRLFRIAYRSGGLKINGWLTLPPSESQRHPAILFNRGGSGPRGVLTDVGAMAFIGMYSSWGYVGIASNYRGTGGSDGTEEWGRGDVDDSMQLIDILDTMDNVDPDALGLIGGSRGGMMALMMLTRTNRFRAAITFGAPTSLHLETGKSYIRSTMAKHTPRTTSEQAQAERLSAVLWAETLCKTTPLLVMHGTGDRRVPPTHALNLGARLQEINHPYKLIMYDNADHVLAGRREESNSDMRWWIDRYVKTKAPLPTTGPHGA